MENPNLLQPKPQDGSNGPSDHTGTSAQPTAASGAAPAVRFSSNVEEFSPPKAAASSSPEDTMSASAKGGEVSPDQLKALTQSLHGAKLQEERLKNYSFEPFSLPPSRVPSHDDSNHATPQQSRSPMGHQSPRLDPKGPEFASPPLTPAGTSLADSPVDQSSKSGQPNPAERVFEHDAITPQASGHTSAPVSPRIPLRHRPASTDDIPERRASGEDRESTTQNHRRSMFVVGAGGSLPVSREPSPSRLSASQFYTRPLTPAGDINDPYAASRRPALSKATGGIDQRFVFSRKKKHGSPGSSTTSLSKQEKRQSGFLGVLNKGDSATGTDSTPHSRQGSTSDLRRFFKVGGSHKVKKSASPPSQKGTGSTSSSRSVHQVPFADDHGLTSRYGKIGRVLGSGAGGSVKLMKRNEDNTVFAVKEFRPRHSYETEKEYVKKLTAEFCVGSALHHGNIIETLDIVQEKGKWYEVMEYAPYDLFAIVMTGKMSKPEVTCCFLQILSGVTYLHSSGLAHRDLKLDNVVVSEHGIMKIIDFGSAHVFKYPFESEIVLATGIVGSDPYLAPEVYDERKYDPQAVDIWSLAIIFCCMSLRRFPWKLPRLSDTSYKLFASPPTPGHDPSKLIAPSRSTGDLATTPQRDMFPEDIPVKDQQKSNKSEPSQSQTTPSEGSQAAEKKETIRGPWRLLRLLPRESRHIIGRMLAIDPKKRATMVEILDEPWVSDTVICRQIGPGQVVKAEDHTHVLEPPAPAGGK